MVVDANIEKRDQAPHLYEMRAVVSMPNYSKKQRFTFRLDQMVRCWPAGRASRSDGSRADSKREELAGSRGRCLGTDELFWPLRKRKGRCLSLERHRPFRKVRAVVADASVIAYSSIRPRRVRARRRGVAFFLHSGQGEMMLSVLAAGAVAPVGTIHSSTARSDRQPPSTVTSRPASMPRVLTR